jgi:hypothetical protein
MSAVETRPPTATRRTPAVHVARHLLGAHARLGVWLWGLLAVIAVVLTTVLARVDRVRTSTWEMLDQGPKWFLFAMGIMVVTGWFGPHVANGMTRRSFTAVTVAVTAATATGYAVAGAIGFLAERAVFAARGWPLELESEHLFSATDQVGAVVLELTVLGLVYGLSGLLVGAVYYRTGGWWGTLTLPLTVGPVLVAEGLLRTGWVGTVLRPLADLDALPAGVVVAGCVLLAAALAAVTHAVLRAAPVRGRPG